MTLTEKQKSRAYAMLDDGKSSAQIAKSVRIPLGSAAALKANHTRKQVIASNKTRLYSVTGTFVVEATNREDALAVMRPSRIQNTKVLSVESAVTTTSRRALAASRA